MTQAMPDDLWRDFPKTATAFETRFATEEDCRAYWIAARWGGEPSCARCNSTRVWTIREGTTFECADCGHQTSLTSGTLLEKTRTPGELQLIGTFVGDETADARGVPVLQRQLLAGAATALASVERPVAPFIARLHPFANEASVDTNRSGRFLPGLATIDQRYRTSSKLGLYRRFQLAEISIPHHAEEVA